jgi:hypothetical protein
MNGVPVSQWPKRTIRRGLRRYTVWGPCIRKIPEPNGKGEYEVESYVIQRHGVRVEYDVDRNLLRVAEGRADWVRTMELVSAMMALDEWRRQNRKAKSKR